MYRQDASNGDRTPVADQAPSGGRLRDLAQVYFHLFDLARESERQLVSEVDGRADVHADVQSFAERELDRNGPLETAFCDCLAVSGHGDLAALAHAAAVVF